MSVSCFKLEIDLRVEYYLVYIDFQVSTTFITIVYTPCFLVTCEGEGP